MKKSDLELISRGQCLGMLVDTIRERVYPTDSWITRFQDVADKFPLHPSPLVKMWQQILSHLASLKWFVVGQDQVASFSVAAEDSFVVLFRHSSIASPLFPRVASHASDRAVEFHS